MVQYAMKHGVKLAARAFKTSPQTFVDGAIVKPLKPYVKYGVMLEFLLVKGEKIYYKKQLKRGQKTICPL